MLRREVKLSLAAVFAGLLSIAAFAADKPVSFYSEVVPVFKRSCNGCHHPGKLKGQLDLTTYEAFKKGGKHGAAFVPGDTEKSTIIEEITGAEPSMPKEGDPLSKAEVAMIERWIKEGAKDDTPANAGSYKLAEPPTYVVPPVVSAMAFSPDGKILAVSGYHEVVLHSSDGSNLLARYVGESPQIESLTFSTDGKLLGVAGSAPARFGEVQIWDATEKGLGNPTNALLKSFKVSTDSIYGLSFSPDAKRVAFGGADKSVRIISAEDGKELLKFDNHSDWIFATLWLTDGKRILSGSRDKALKLIDASSSQFIDDINKLLEGVTCMARHPKEDVVVYGGDLGTTRIYKISDNQGRTAANNDVNLKKEFERLPGAVHAVAFSADGNTIAVGGVGPEVRVFNAADGKKLATLKGHEGAIFSVLFNPATSNQVVTAGFDGKVRVYETGKGTLVKEFVPVPIKKNPGQQQAAK